MVIPIAVKEELLDALDGKFFVLQGKLVRLWSKEVGVAKDILREGGREENDLHVLWE